MGRVVVTGMGALTPVGLSVDAYWNSLKNGKVGISLIENFDTTEFKAKVAGEIKDFNPEDYMEKKKARKMDRFTQFGVVAFKEAYAQSGLDTYSDLNKKRMGVICGAGVGGMITLEEEHIKLLNRGPKKVSPLFIPKMISNIAAGNIAIEAGAKGPCLDILSACATSTNCIGEAFRMIKENIADVMICGGTEASITPLSVAGFINITALSKNPDPKKASRPFDANRDGFVMGEGSGILIIEDYEHAKARNAEILGEIVSYATTCDAYHIVATHKDGEGLSDAIELAIERAGIKKEDIKYVNAHGTSTQDNEITETKAIKTALGDHAYDICVSSTKSMTGHLLGAAGAVESIACIKALSDQFVHPTMGYETKDPKCDLDVIPNKGRSCEMEYVLSNSSGFGGHNACLIFKKI